MNKMQLICDPTTGMCSDASDEMVELNFSKKNEKIQISFYTDPICSSCWALEPVHKRLEAEYGDYFNVSYKMGGLLKSWDGFMDVRNGISGPNDVAHHWDDVGKYSGMPIDGDVWYEDPLDSSYPASIGYKAAQLQDPKLADKYLRRVREMVFLEKKNVAKEENLIQSAKDVGLDSLRFKNDLHGDIALNEFIKEMNEGRELGVRGFPTLIFQKGEKGILLSGMQSFDTYVSALAKLSEGELVPSKKLHSIYDVINRYGLVSTFEISELLQRDLNHVRIELEKMASCQEIQKVPVKEGFYWKVI